MIIRKARMNEIDILNQLYENARKFMHTHGNPSQWTNGYPSKTDIMKDIDENHLYVVDINGSIEGVFYYYEGEDPSYAYIEKGDWLNKESYAVVHRVVSAMRIRRMGDTIIQYCQSQKDNIRIDTHEDNIPMQKMLERNGFCHVGTIYLKDGSPRRAYHWCKHCNINKN